MLYKKNEQEFSEELFRNPGAEYRGVPFWAWNTKMTKEDVDNCLDAFRTMGMGGCFLHSRTGMDIPYLSDEFMDLICYAQEKAEERGLHAWLYDEDRWPSGFAGGLVTKNREYRARYLVWSPRPYYPREVPEESGKGSTAAAVRSGDRKFLGAYLVKAENGYMKEYRRVDLETLALGQVKPEEGRVWWAYLEICGDNPWFNGQSYVDTLNPEAVREFLNVTYERYRERLGEDFGSKIPGIFTDEPQFTPKQRAGSIDSEKEVILPFTDRLPGEFEKQYGFDILDALPELFYEREGKISRARYCYHELVSRMFAESYAKQIGQWCETYGIALTGHLMKEPLLSSQTEFVGDAMRSYAGFQIPGIDMLCDRREFTTAKQAQSAVHQYGREGMISELYGVTNWDYDFTGHKLQGDWQAALGVTVRAPHLAWTSMEGEAKRDYPASICYQSPWYQEYRLIEDYFARVGAVMSRGKAGAKVGVIHPVETCWLNWGTMEKTGEKVRELDEQFLRLTSWLLGMSVDFDFISESLLPELYKGSDNGRMTVGEMEYQAVLVPEMETMRSGTLTALEEFKLAGGEVLFVGGVPETVDAEPSEKPMALAKACRVLPDSRTRIYEALKKYADLELFYGDYDRADDVICQMRTEGEKRWLFLAHREKPDTKETAGSRNLVIRIKGLWDVTLLNALDGTIQREEGCIRRDGMTVLKKEFYAHDSLLFCLTPAEGGLPESAGEREKENANAPEHAVQNDGQNGGQNDGRNEIRPVKEWQDYGPVPVTLSEPNVLILDMPEYSFDGQPWQTREEILRIDNKIRKQLGYPLRMEAWPQPWTQKGSRAEGQETHRIELRYYIWSEYEMEEVGLALEQPEETAIFWNGYPVESRADGWYVDRRIRTVKLSGLEKGVNELCLIREFHQGANLEAVYLLGDFGVRVAGGSKVITEPVRSLYFGDWTVQGLPFYGGNVTYKIELEGEGRPLKIGINKFAAPLLRVDYRGEKQGIIAFSPYELVTGPVEKGEQCLDITAYGSRVNTFGALHNCDSGDNKAAPNYWRTTGAAWSYEYCLRPAGILKAPVITRC